MSSTSNEEYVDRGAGDLDRLERLWAPYRMNYIVDKSDTNGSGNTHTNPFVVIPTLSDEDGLIVARGTYVYCVLNLFPLQFRPHDGGALPGRTQPRKPHPGGIRRTHGLRPGRHPGAENRLPARRLQRRLQPGPLRRPAPSPNISTCTSCPGGTATATS